MTKHDVCFLCGYKLNCGKYIVKLGGVTGVTNI